MPYISIQPDFRLFYHDDDFTDPWLESPAVLLQHGFSRNGRFWYSWLPLLAREYRVLRPDMRGLGFSSVPEDKYEPSVDTFVTDLVKLLDALSIPRVIFVGESFGGIIGLEFARSYPERTRALVLCNTPCRLPAAELRQRFSTSGDWEAAMDRGVGVWSRETIDMRLDTRMAPEGLKDWYIAEMDRTPPKIAGKLQSYVHSLDFREQLKEIRVPTLLLVGELTPTSPLPQQQLMHERIPNSRLVVFPGVGHGINAIYPERCVEELRRFVSALPD